MGVDPSETALGGEARMRRPRVDPALDPSRAAERAADPAGWRLDAAARDGLAEVVAGRRDIRRFRPDPLPEALVRRLLAAAHRAPSVGLSQPWRFVVVRDPSTRAQVRALAQRERLRQAPRFERRAAAFLDQKVEGILEAPIGICVCCVPPPPGVEVLGRATIPETDVHSTACAIQNLWLTARAEGVGVGWVSFYRPDDLRAALAIPPEVLPLAWLCVGWPDERPPSPGLERAGWATRRPLDDVVHEERWSEGSAEGGLVDGGSGERGPVDGRSGERGLADGGPIEDGRTDREPSGSDPSGCGRPAGPGPFPDAEARTAARDRADRLVRPAGSLGALDELVERWSAATGAPPPVPLRAAHLICAADHGHVARGTSLFAGTTSRQVAEAAARGETAIGVLARARGERLAVADLGLRGGTPAGCLDRSCSPTGSADFVRAPALTEPERDRALEAGAALAHDLLETAGAACLVLGEIGIGNTTTAAALLCALTGIAPEAAAGRGTGVDAAGLDRKRETIRAGLDRAGAGDALDALRQLGGLELAALVGAIHAAHARRVPVLLDGLAVGVAALIAARLRPACREWLVAGHRSAEPAHEAVLRELGLEPLLDLRLRVGEGTGAALALPLIEQAGRLHHEMATFDEASVDGPVGQPARGSERDGA